jgi:hypothetical protein
MTISSQTTRVSYIGDGSTTAFSVPFYFQANADLTVYLLSASGVKTLQVLGTDYTLTGAGIASGGTCTFAAAPTATTGASILIYRDPPATQTTSYNNNDPFPAKSHENALDKLTMLIQRLKERVGRSAILSEFSTFSGLTLPDPEAGKYLKWKQDNSGLENSSEVTFSPNSYPIATQSEAEAGTSNTVLMTPLRWAQALTNKLATQAAALAGTDNTTVMTPLRTQQALNSAFGSPLESIVGISPLGGRLTLTSATPVTTADVAAATSIYYTPHVSSWVRIYNGTTDVLTQFTETALALDSSSGHTGYHQSGKNFDCFVALNSSTFVLGTGPAWSSDTARGTGAGTTEIEFYNGLWRNKNDITLRIGTASGNTVLIPARQATLVGSFRATADGQASDTVLRRLLSNAYNPVPRFMFANAETLGTTWTYTLLTWRQVHANTSNKVEFLQCLPGGPVESVANSQAANSAGSATFYVGIGVNSTTVNSAKGGLLSTVAAGLVSMGYADYSGFASLGYTYLAWLEISAVAGTTSWYAGDSAAAAVFTCGIRAKVWN